MANPYAYNVLTFAGAALIAQATAANPIVIVGAISRATAASSDEDLADKDASWYTGKTGTIEAVSASANVAKIVARFDPEGARQDAKSIAVTARLASQTDADAIVLTAKSDPDATAILPGSGDTLAYARFPFNIHIQTSGSVQVTPGASASIADLARFVSLHKAGDPTAGDVQTIKGEKTFESKIIANGGVQSHEIQFVTDSVPGATAKIEGITSDDTTTTTARTTASAGYEGGAHSQVSCSVTANGANYQGYAEFTVAKAGQTACGIMFEYNSANYSAQNPHNACLASIACGNRYCTYNGEIFRIRGALQLTDGTNSGTLSIAGTAAMISAAVFVVGSGQSSQIQVNKLCLTNDPDDAAGFIYWDDDNYVMRINRAIWPDDDAAYDLGTDDYSWNDIYANRLRLPNMDLSYDDDTDALTINCSLSSNDDGYYDLGRPDYRWANVYAKNFFGCIPQPTSDTTEPVVGTIFFAQIVFNSSVTANAKIGAEAKVGQTLGGSSSNVGYIRQASWNSAQNEWQSGGSSANFSTGKYKLLSGLVVTNETVGYALVMRI